MPAPATAPPAPTAPSASPRRGGRSGFVRRTRLRRLCSRPSRICRRVRGVRAGVDEPDRSRPADVELLDAAKAGDQAWRSGCPPEAPCLERVRERVNADRAFLRAFEELAGDRK